MPQRQVVGYIPFRPSTHSTEAEWLAEHLSVSVRVARHVLPLNDAGIDVAALGELEAAVHELLELPAVVAEGPAGFLWAAVLRQYGFSGSVAVVPYLNPHRWQDVAAVALYRRFARPTDRIFVGSTPSADVYRSLGLHVSVGEPYGIDAGVLRIRPFAERTRLRLGIPPGRMLMFAGRMQADKDVYRVLRAGLMASVLFSDLQVVVASHVEDRAYAEHARRGLNGREQVHFISDPAREQLADLYSAADLFVTASTSAFETFGRAAAEALACGTPVIAPAYDGFPEVLDQPGGRLVDVNIDPRGGAPHVDDEMLLRAIYDALSSPHLPQRNVISQVARSRFGRATTIQQLSYLTSRARPVDLPIALASRVGAPALPDAWRAPLRRLTRSNPAAALAWFFDACEHRRLAAHDGEFSTSVRRALCRQTREIGDGVRACR